MAGAPTASKDGGVSETLLDDSDAGPSAAGQALPSHELAPGCEVGRYVVLQRIGAGGMGVVYSAYDPDLDRKVALKLLQPDELEGERATRGHARLMREAQAMAKLTHPNVVTVHDVGTYGSRVFIAMEFVAGGTLRQWLAEQRPRGEIIDVFVAAGRGLVAAHAEGIVHRDFKPDNVLVGTDGRARVVDFGLARRAAERGPDAEPRLDVRTPDGVGPYVTSLTATGSRAGTPAYMAPEQHRGDPVDHRTDQFSFAVALWEALYGKRPFAGKGRAALAYSVCSGEIEVPPAGTKVPTSVFRALSRALLVEPGDRFESMRALLAALQRDASRTRTRALLAVVVLGLPTLLVAGAVWSTDEPCSAGPGRVASAWNAGTRDAVRSGFSATEARFAAAAATRAIGQLDRYAEQWQLAYRDACEATHVRHEESTHGLDLRMACLTLGLAALEATGGALAVADATGVRKAADAIGQLPSIADCADVPELGLVVAPSNDPETAAAVQRSRVGITEAWTQGSLGAYADALAQATALDDAAQEVAYPPLAAETALVVGSVAAMAGRPERAEAALRRAVFQALSADHDRILAQAATRLISVVGIDMSRYDDAAQWAWYAEAAVARLGEGSAEDGALAQTMCKMLADKSESARALPHCHRALALAIARFGDDHLVTADAHEALGIALYYGGDDDSAEREFLRARDTFVANKGEEHPDLGRLQNSLAAVCLGLRPAQACLPEFVEAVRLSIAALGPRHPQVADFTNNLAEALLGVGRVQEARARADQALTLRRSLGGEEHPGIAASLSILGRIAKSAGELARAEALLAEGLAVAERTRGDTHRDVLSLHRELASVLAVQGSSDAARGHYEAALAVARALRRSEDIVEVKALLAALPAALPR